MYKIEPHLTKQLIEYLQNSIGEKKGKRHGTNLTTEQHRTEYRQNSIEKRTVKNGTEKNTEFERPRKR